MGFRSHLALDDPHRPQRILPSQTLLKNGPTGLVWKQGLYFLTLPAKTHTSLHRRDNGVIWLCQQLIFRIFSGYIPLVLFFVYAAQFLHRAIFPLSTLITFCRTLLEYYGSLFCFLRCDRMRFLKLPQNWPKSALL